MTTPVVTFVETMRGQVVMTRFVNTSELLGTLAKPEAEDAEAIAESLRQGAEHDLALPMVWGDLAIAVANQPNGSRAGLSGVIESGRILVSGLAEAPLRIERGEFGLLPVTPNGERRMRYRLECATEEGQRYLLYGFKRIANCKGRFLPSAIWQDTTTLFVTISEMDAFHSPRSLVATGMIHIFALDFLKQLLTMRSRGVAGFAAVLCNLAGFGWFFGAGVLSAYLPQTKIENARPI